MVTTSLPDGDGNLGNPTAVGVFLTKHVLRRPSLLVCLYKAMVDKKPIIPINLVGRGYDYRDAAQYLGNLQASVKYKRPLPQ